MQEKEGVCFFQRDVMAYIIYTLIFEWVRTTQCTGSVL